VRSVPGRCVGVRGFALVNNSELFLQSHGGGGEVAPPPLTNSAPAGGTDGRSGVGRMGTGVTPVPRGSNRRRGERCRRCAPFAYEQPGSRLPFLARVPRVKVFKGEAAPRPRKKLRAALRLARYRIRCLKCRGQRRAPEYGDRPCKPLTAASTVNREHFLGLSHAPERVPTHRQQLLAHALRGLRERLGNQDWL